MYYAFDLLDKDKSGEVDQGDLVRAMKFLSFVVWLVRFRLYARALPRRQAKAYDTSKHPEVIRGEKTPAEVLKEFSEQWDGTKKDG